MSITFALAGNPNSGKTTLFNSLTGSNQYVGNWPGVTVEKKEGKYKKNKDVTITDLPGIYSLSPYTLEEVVARNYLINEHPDAILNIVDGTNIERNLYLTTQLMELGIPVVVAINMMDVVKKSGDKINTKLLSEELGCPIVEISAIKGHGIEEAADAAIKAAEAGTIIPKHTFGGIVEHTLAHIEEAALHDMPEDQQRWFAIKIFERDDKVLEKLNLSQDIRDHIETDIKAVEEELDDDSESIITNERYVFIAEILKHAYKKKSGQKLTVSDKIDKVLTNRILALPIFVVVMFLVYAVAMGPWAVSIGTRGTDWANDCLFGDGFHLLAIGDRDYNEAAAPFEDRAALMDTYEEEAAKAKVDFNEDNSFTCEDDDGNLITFADYNDAAQWLEANADNEPDPADFGVWVPGIPVLFEKGLTAIGTWEWLTSLILDGVVGGVGAVLGFVPQMLVLFLFLALLEDCGYMARVAFIMDRIFRKFGLSGKSFIPMLVATGCGVPGIMASRTIEQDRDRKMTIMTTGFIPCGAKMPIIGLIAGALFGGSAAIATASYFIGVGAVIISGIILKKTKMFAGDPAPFVMELPAYHMPVARNVLRATWERGWSFIKRAGTIILASSIVIWILNSLSFEGGFHYLGEGVEGASLLEVVGKAVCWIFIPLGFGNWQATVATVLGLVAKEEVVGVFGTLSSMADADIAMGLAEESSIRLAQTVGSEIFGGVALAGLSFLIFNLLCAPCFAAMGAIKREMNSGKWTAFAIIYMCVFAYSVSLMVFQFGAWFFAKDQASVIGTIFAALVLAGFIYFLFRKNKYSDSKLEIKE